MAHVGLDVGFAAGVGVGQDHTVGAVEFFQNFRGEGFGRRAIGADVAVDTDNLVEAFRQVGKVVGCQHDHLALVAKALQHRDDSLLGATSTPLKASSSRIMLASWASARAMNTR